MAGRGLLRFRPSMKRTSPLSVAALVVAVLALVASMGGASYAAKVITGKDIKNGSITGKDIKKKSLTGTQIKNSSLTGADVKDGSLNGGDLKDGSLGAAELAPGTLEPKLRSVRVPATAGASFDAARTAAPETVLFSAGGLTIYAKCFTDTSATQTNAVVYIKTAQNGALVDSDYDDYFGGAATDFLNTTTEENDREITFASANANSASIYGSHSVDFAAFGPGGTALSGLTPAAAKNGTLAGGDGAYGAGDACLFGANVRSN